MTFRWLELSVSIKNSVIPGDYQISDKCRAWNQAKSQRAPWWADNSKEAYSSGLANLATTLSNWSKSKAGAPAGRRVAFPRFKGAVPV
ncbi:MAG: hypothetical protein M3Y73_13315 [Actinomycetota bacterium]|nr:hypothetical protein [Actinomycetota bacterium]